MLVLVEDSQDQPGGDRIGAGRQVPTEGRNDVGALDDHVGALASGPSDDSANARRHLITLLPVAREDPLARLAEDLPALEHAAE